MDKGREGQKYIGILLLSFVIIFFVIIYSTDSKATNNNMKDLESQKQENEEHQSSYEEQASGLEESKASLENLVSSLNSELAVIGEKINEIERQISEKENEIEENQAALDEAKESEDKQYADMKLRIKFMYEMGDKSYFDILFSGDSIADNINKAEYVSSLVGYDRMMLIKYKEAKELRIQKEEELSVSKQELLKLKEEADEQIALIQEKIHNTNQSINLYASEIAEAEAKALEYEKKVEQNRSQMELESRRIEEESIIAAEKAERERRERESREQASREQASRDAEGQTGETGEEDETTKPPSSDIVIDYEPAESDLDMLAALIECEAGDQTYYGMLCVGAVVMNRIASSRFPNTLYEVIYQPYQFTPVTVSNRFALVLARGANETCYKAAREVLLDGNIVGNWLFFRMNDGSRDGEVIGDHVFY